MTDVTIQSFEHRKQIFANDFSAEIDASREHTDHCNLADFQHITE